MEGSAAAPLTPAQERLWVLQNLAPDDASYNIFLSHRLRGTLDVAALRSAFDAVVARHEPLRTRYPESADGPRQLVLPPAPVALEQIDLSGLGTGEREDAAHRLVAERTNAPFDLVTRAPIRVTLLRLAPDEHVLCLVVHHIAADGWSMTVLARELSEVYAAAVTGSAHALPELPTSFRDHVVAGRSGDGAGAALEYWRSQLADPPILELPLDRPRPRERSSAGGVVTRVLPPPLVRRLHDVARGERCTPFMALFAAYAALLARHTGQSDICIATPVAGRDRVELEGLVGYFSTTLVLRCDLDGAPSFGELMKRVRRTLLQGMRHQAVPIEQLLVDLAPERDRSTPPVFQTMFVLQNAAAPGAVTAPLAGLDPEWFDAGCRQTKLDLMLDVLESPEEEPGSLLCAFGYSTDVLDATTVERIADRWVTLVESLVSAAARPVRDASLHASGERSQMRAWGSGPDLPDERTGELDVLARFDTAVAAAPHAPAVVCGAATLTYAELSARADDLAGELRASGVRPGHLVGIALPRGTDAIAALLAAARAGAGYLPLDPDSPSRRVEELAADAGVVALLTSAGVATAPGPHLVVPDAAYVITTSGSTGRPKGVLVGHDALAARVAWMISGYGLTGRDRVVQFAALTFDTHAEEIWPTLAAGATLVLLPNGPVALPDVLGGDPRITVLDLPTAYWHRLVDDIDDVDWPPALRLVVLGGEQVDGAAVTRWRRRFPDVRLINTYGPTEGTIIATAAELDGRTARPPIGRPIAATTVRVVDAAGEPAPIGVPGELWIGGRGVAIGYLDRPRLTADQFVPDPSGPPGSRMYRTGDRARWRPTGELEFLGRLDEQVKVRGHRIEPGEVEARLLDHPAVSGAVVTARDDRLVAHVVISDRTDRDDVGLDGTGLRAFVAEALPASMVPDVVVPVEALPLTRHGKVDRRALPEPAAPAARTVVAPRTDAEALVARVWSEVLGLPLLGRDDDFFGVGGHSLHALRVASRLRAAAGIDVPVRVLFTHPTLAGLATAVEDLVLAEIEQLTDEEAGRLLAEQGELA